MKLSIAPKGIEMMLVVMFLKLKQLSIAPKGIEISTEATADSFAASLNRTKRN